MTTIEYADSLRKLADFYEANPEMQLPYFSADTDMAEVHIYVYYTDQFWKSSDMMMQAGPIEVSTEDGSGARHMVKGRFGKIQLVLSIPATYIGSYETVEEVVSVQRWKIERPITPATVAVAEPVPGSVVDAEFIDPSDAPF